MYDNLYCKVFLDTNLSYENLFSIVWEYIGGNREALTYINTDWCEISIQKNKEYNVTQYLMNANDFIYWKYYLDIEPVKCEENMYINKLSDLLKYLKGYCRGVIAACDFEEELGIRLSDN